MTNKPKGDSMNSKAIIITTIIAVFALAVAAFFVIFNDNYVATSNEATSNTQTSNDDASESPVSDQDTEQEETIVTYTNNGFSPATMTIDKGTTVTFVNESSGLMWVASDNHPSHQKYSAFDQGRSIGSGQSYSFTFEQAGTWGYHNHVAPNDTGTVVVQ